MSTPDGGQIPSSPEHFSEADLEAALEALAGDPTDDAAAVLEVLPGPRALPLGPLVATAAAAGLAAGWFLSTITPQVEPEIPVPMIVSSQLNNPLIEQIQGSAWLIDDDEKETILRSGMRVDPGSRVHTGKESVIFVSLPGSKIELRAHSNTEFRVDRAASATLLQGTLWVQVPKNEHFLVETIEGSLKTMSGAFAIEASRSGILASTYAGEMTFIGISDDEIPLPEGKSCDSMDGDVSDSRKAKPSFRYLKWQAPLMLKSGRDAELLQHVYPLVTMLANDDLRDSAERNLRIMGTIGATALINMMYEIDASEVELRRRSSYLLLDIGDMASCGMWMPNINDPDPTVRTNLVMMMERITGISSGGSRQFWLTATQADRYNKILRYRKKLESFK